jgi:predicted lactoylglutathione lyase
MSTKSTNIFVNLAVKDLARSREFFTKLGYSFNSQFSDERAICLVIGDNIFAMLLTEPFYKTFTDKQLADTSTTSEVMVALTADSREQVDQLVNAAFSAGGRPSGQTMDEGFMYGRAFQDLDGHIWEVVWMDAGSMEQLG